MTLLDSLNLADKLTGFRQPEDSEIEVSYLGDKTRLAVIDSIWGNVGTVTSRFHEFNERHQQWAQLGMIKTQRL